MFEEIETYIPSAAARRLLYALGALALALLIFAAGFSAGLSHARYAYLPDRMHGFMGGMPGEFMLPHLIEGGAGGAVGTIQTSGAGVLTMQGRDGSTLTILISTSTALRDIQGGTSTSALEPGAGVVVFGFPNPDGSINARLIRFLPH